MAKRNKDFARVEEKYSRAIFRDLPGFLYDECRWQDPTRSNAHFRLPSLEHVDISTVPVEFFKSGVDGGRSLDLDEINVLEERGQKGWYPGVHRGSYFVHKNHFYLHGADSVYDLVEDKGKVAGRYGVSGEVSYRHLIFDRATYTPVSLSFLERDLEDLSIDFADSWSLVDTHFTKKAENGVFTSEVDTTVKEFLISPNVSAPRTYRITKNVEDQETVKLTALNGAANWYRLKFTHQIVRWYRPVFSRRDLFKNERPSTLTLQEMNAASNGDYKISYGLDGYGVVDVKLDPNWYARSTFFGSVRLKPASSSTLICNGIVATSQAVTMPPGSPSRLDSEGKGVQYFLPKFPVGEIQSVLVDNVAFSPVEGPIQGRAAGVPFAATLEDYKALVDGGNGNNNDTIYQLDRLNGVLRFGQENAEVPGKFVSSDQTVVVTYTPAPIVRYDVPGGNVVFYDKKEDLDPLRNTIKQGFIVLDNKRPQPFRIRLATVLDLFDGDECLFGPLTIPAIDDSDFGGVKARVESRTGEGIPNVPVEFMSLDGLTEFTKKIGATDADGCVYSEVYGKAQYGTFMTKVELWAQAGNLNETRPLLDQIGNIDYSLIDASVVWDPVHPYGQDANQDPWAQRPDLPANLNWENNTIILEGKITATPAEIYLFVTSEPAVRSQTFTRPNGEEVRGTRVSWIGELPGSSTGLTPWRWPERKGGLTTVWHSTSSGTFANEVRGDAGAELYNPKVIIHPVGVIYDSLEEVTRIVFNRALPLPWQRGEFIPPEKSIVRQFTLAVDRTASIQAKTLQAPLLTSNVLSMVLQLGGTTQGQFRLLDPSLPAISAGTRIDAATFVATQSPILLISQVYAQNGNPLGVDENGRFPFSYSTATTIKIRAIDPPDDLAALQNEVIDKDAFAFILPGTELNVTSGAASPLAEGAAGTTTELKMPVFIVGLSSGKIVKSIKINENNVTYSRINQQGEPQVEVTVVVPSVTANDLGGATDVYLSLGGFHPGDFKPEGVAARSDHPYIDDIRRSSIPVSFS